MSQESFLSEVASDLETLREKSPLIHQITNYVVMNETANITLAMGGSPVMAHAPEEVEEMVGFAGALVLNIGTLESAWIDSMVIAGKAANAKGVPVVLDPVGVGATRLRTEAAGRILDEVDVTVIRGNASEVSVLAGAEAEIKGVDSVGEFGALEMDAKNMSRSLGCVVAITGANDVISDTERTIVVSNGDPMMAKITGTGCMSSALVGCFLAVNRDPIVAAAGGLTAFGIAGQKAAAISGNRPGTFHVALYDEVAELNADAITSLGKATFIGI